MEDKCKWCKTKGEDVSHALVFCQPVWDVWSACLPIVHNFTGDMSVIEMATTLRKCEDVEALKIFFVIAWRFCFCRNKWIHDETNIMPKEFVEHVASLHRCFKELKPIRPY